MNPALAALALLAVALSLGYLGLAQHRQVRRYRAQLADERVRFQNRLGQLEQREAHLREGMALFRAFFDQAAVGVAQIETASGLFVRINPRLCELLGLTAQEAIARDYKTLTHPDDLPANWVQMQRLINGETRRYCLDQRYLRPDGTAVWVALEVSALWEPGAPPDYHLAVVQDIDTRKTTEFALRHARAHAEHLLAEAEQSRRVLLSLIEDQEAAGLALRANEERDNIRFPHRADADDP